MASSAVASSISRRIATANVSQSATNIRCISSLLVQNGTFSPVSSNSSSNVVVRFLSKKKDGDDDPFGLKYKDSTDVSSGNIGQKDKLPPLYKRDADTGKFTGKIEAEFTDKDRELLNMSELDKERELTSRFLSSREEQLSDAAERIREETLALNVLGRTTSNAASSEDDVSAPLTDEEYESLKQFLKEEYGPDDAKTMLDQNKDANLIATASKSSNARNNNGGDEDDANPDMNLKWMTSAAQRQMQDLGVHTSLEEEEDPFASLMPADLNPARKVNRKLAQPIPKELLHHNNLLLLRRYITPGGQIMNRVQSRLGAKDQRKISKLIKRARHLGLIPYMGQWKGEDTGNIHESDIMEERDWEKDLLQRGIIQRKSPIWKENTNTPKN